MRRELLDRAEIAREQLPRLFRGRRRGSCQADDLAEGPIIDLELALDQTRRRFSVAAVATEEACEGTEEGGQRGRGLADELGDRVAPAVRLEIPLAQVQQVAAGFHFAGMPEVDRVHTQAHKRVSADNDRVVGDDGAELERERVERPAELAGGDQEGRGQPAIVPACGPGRTAAEVVGCQHVNEGERRDWRRPYAARVAVDHQRLHTRAEHFAKLTLERSNSLGNLHEPIVRRKLAPGRGTRINFMRLRELNVGCFGGGTGLPSLLGGLKHNPWLRADAVVTMFDSGGSSGVLRDEHGVLPPGDILKCALALSRNTREARRVLLARLPTLEDSRLGGHTGGNLLLSMMQRYSGDFLDAIDGLRALLGCRGRVWPVSVQQASVCAEYGDGSVTRGEVEVDAGQSSGRFIRRTWLEPTPEIHPGVAAAIGKFDAVIIGPGSFYTSLMPIFQVCGVAEALKEMKGPVVLVANLLTEGRGMLGFTAADAVRQLEEAIERRVDVVMANTRWPSSEVLLRYAVEHKEPLATGDLPQHCELVGGEFWTGEIARHDRPRLSYAVWSVLSRRLLNED